MPVEAIVRSAEAPAGRRLCGRGRISADSIGPALSRLHPENHLVARIGWLRAAVLGANDGIVSTASLVVGVAAASAGPSAILLTGVAGLVAGAMSIAAGEYVSVSSQSGTETADLAREAQEIADRPEAEHAEPAGIYIGRGLESGLAHEVARQLMARDALGAHARDELGLTPGTARGRSRRR